MPMSPAGGDRRSVPAHALQRVAERERDLVVVGSSHHGPLGHVLLGDVAASALHHAPCAIAVAPRGYAAHDGAVRTIGVGFDGGEESQAALKLAAGLAKKLGAEIAILYVLATRFRGVSVGLRGGLE